MAAFLGGAETLDDLLELVGRQNNLGHVEADAELGVSDMARAEFVKVAEELGNASALLLAEEADTSENVFHVVRLQPHDLGLDLAWLGARVVVEGLAMGTADTKDALVRIYLVAEVDIVNLICVTLVHVTSEN